MVDIIELIDAVLPVTALISAVPYIAAQRSAVKPEDGPTEVDGTRCRMMIIRCRHKDPLPHNGREDHQCHANPLSAPGKQVPQQKHRAHGKLMLCVVKKWMADSSKGARLSPLASLLPRSYPRVQHEGTIGLGPANTVNTAVGPRPRPSPSNNRPAAVFRRWVPQEISPGTEGVFSKQRKGLFPNPGACTSECGPSRLLSLYTQTTAQGLHPSVAVVNSPLPSRIPPMCFCLINVTLRSTRLPQPLAIVFPFCLLARRLRLIHAGKRTVMLCLGGGGIWILNIACSSRLHACGHYKGPETQESC